MYDELTVRFRVACPERGGVSVRLSAFRRLERLPGPVRPAVFQVSFACPCGDEHAAIVTHDELDWRPVAGSDLLYQDLMTGRRERAGRELAERAASEIGRGGWPWTLYCVWESRPRPTYPSAFRMLAPREGGLLVAARCSCCGRSSINGCTADHVDVPFFNDREVGVVRRAVDDPGTLDDVFSLLAGSASDLAQRPLAA